jgi:hypothetical protein
MPERYCYELRSPINEAGVHMPPGKYVGHIVPEIPPRRAPRVRLYVPGDSEHSVVVRGGNVVRLGPVDD